ncbi:hypothetical protein ACFQDR_23915 [Sulfitobacter sediminilitoris]
MRWQRKLRETGSIEPELQGRPSGHGKLSAHQAFLEELVAQDGDITLPEPPEHWKLPLALPHTQPPSGDFCANLGTHIKKPLVATERLRAHVKERRKNWFRHHLPAMQAHPDRLVFIPSRDIAAQCTAGQWTKHQ